MTAGEAQQREMLRLLESEQSTLQNIISGVLTNGTAVRVAGFALWSAIVGFAVQDKQPLLTLVAGAVLLACAIVDAYHAHLYQRALEVTINNDDLIRTWYAMQGRDFGNATQQTRLQVKLQAHDFGAYRSLQALPAPAGQGRMRKMLNVAEYIPLARPNVVFAVLYPALVVGTVIAGVLLALLP